MANTYTQLTIHIVFAVKNRENIIKPKYEEELYKYITGIITNKNQKLLAINGVSDHIHILIGLSPSVALSDIVRDIKSNSSKFINEKRCVIGKFQWQEGYGAFSYSRSQRPEIINYIKKQKEHHQKSSFKEEYLNILKKFDVKYDDEYLFDFFN
ncbi:MAG TPA: IS200/IS605 family transposase [Bacteroidales bacterium]|nr:IS200/IS605 family transposase [Bacteroidales bacterium]